MEVMDVRQWLDATGVSRKMLQPFKNGGMLQVDVSRWMSDCLTLSQSCHQLQASGGSKVDAAAIELVVVEERRGCGGVDSLSHMTHLHRSAGQLEAVQLLQSFFSAFAICKLTAGREKGLNLRCSESKEAESQLLRLNRSIVQLFNSSKVCLVGSVQRHKIINNRMN